MASIIGATRVIKYKKFERQNWKAKKKRGKAKKANAEKPVPYTPRPEMKSPKPKGPPLKTLRKASPPIPLPRPFAFEPAKT